MRLPSFSIAVGATMATVAVALVAPTAAHAASTSYSYRVETQLVSAVNDGEWGDPEPYGSAGTLKDASTGARVDGTAWTGNEDSEDWNVNTKDFSSSTKVTTLNWAEDVWESDVGNGDDYLGWINSSIPVDGAWHSVTGIKGESGSGVTLKMRVLSAPSITTTKLDDGTVGQSFSQTVAATNTSGDIAWSASGLPNGLTIDRATGKISGTPTNSGTATVTITATNSIGTDTVTLPLKVAAAKPAIRTTSLQDGVIGEKYSASLEATGEDISWTATGLPAGLSVNATTGAITGSPTAAGTSTVKVTAANESGSDTKDFQLRVKIAGPTIVTKQLPDGSVNQPYTAQIETTGEAVAVNAADLPTGLSIASNGAISGTPTTAGSFQVEVTASNETGSVSSTLPMTVDKVATPVAFVSPGEAGVISARPDFVGTGEPGATVTVLEGQTKLGAASVNSNGDWSLQLTGMPLQAGAHTFIASQEKSGATTTATAAATIGDGAVSGTGFGIYGQLQMPEALKGTHFLQAVTGGNNSYAITEDYKVVGWGFHGGESIPAELTSGLTQVKAIAAGNSHAAAITSDGKLFVWGTDNNSHHQLDVPAEAKNETFAQVSAGMYHTVAVTTSGKVFAWGEDSSGQSNVPAAAQQGIVQVAAGYNHSIALTDTGEIIGWGDSNDGKLDAPAELKGKTVIQLAAGYNHTVALTADGKVYAWGEEAHHQTQIPAAVNAERIVQVAAGEQHSVALTASGKVITWGEGLAAENADAFAGKVVTDISGAENSTLVLGVDQK